MRGFVIGLILGVALLGAAVVVPGVIRSDADAVEAQRQAELARRQLEAWDPQLDLLADSIDLEAIKQADLDTLLSSEDARTALEELGASFSQRVSVAKSLDREANLESGDLTAVSTSPSGVAAAISGFQQFVDENAQVFSSASSDAQAAVSKSGQAYGVNAVNGIAAMSRAQQLYGAAQRLRTRARTMQTAAITQANIVAGFQARKTHFDSLDTSDTLAQLQQDRDEMQSELTTVKSEADRLRGTVAQRTTELEQLATQIQSAQQQLLQLQDSGFTPGNDSAYSGYRSQYQSLARQLQQHQEREHLLRWGGYETADLDWDAVLAREQDAPMEIDGPVLGIEELERRLALLDDKIARYASGVEALDEQAALINSITTNAREYATVYDDSIAAAQKQLDNSMSQLRELAQAATAKEDEALEATNAALSAFGRSLNAARSLSSEARQIQGDFDPQRQNQRLIQVLGDKYPEQMASTAEAAAQTLLGRIYAERAAGIDGLLRTLELVQSFGATVDEDTEELITLASEAREQGGSALSTAVETYSALANEGSTTAWVFHAATGTTEYLRGQLNPQQAAQFRANAKAALQEAVNLAGQFPYAYKYVLLNDQLSQ